MRYPDLIPAYAHLLCNEDLSEATEDVAQHLFQRASDAGLLRPDGGRGDRGSCSEPMLVRLLEISAAAADVKLRRLLNTLETLLLQEFPTALTRQ
jgi:hypothetical protein